MLVVLSGTLRVCIGCAPVTGLGADGSHRSIRKMDKDIFRDGKRHRLSKDFCEFEIGFLITPVQHLLQELNRQALCVSLLRIRMLVPGA